MKRDGNGDLDPVEGGDRKMLWDKGGNSDQGVIDFTAARDRVLDRELARWDVTGSMAHSVMLYESGIIERGECATLLKALEGMLSTIESEGAPSLRGHEDIHSAIEGRLVELTGDTGKKIHAGRSRNDQVLTALSLYYRYELASTIKVLHSLLKSMAQLSFRYSSVMMPGYTHLQPAMPSSFGLWFGSWAESLLEDMEEAASAYTAVNRSPAGTAAGYGTTMPLKREVVTRLLDFDREVVNSLFIQLRRGKTDKRVADALASAATTLSRLAGDVILFAASEFRFIRIADRFTTGSSIMPQKRNPDVFEIVRARANVVRSLPASVSMLITNLPSGYNRDYQVLKELIFPAFGEVRSLTAITEQMIANIEVREEIIDDSYNQIFAAEEANRLVEEGYPFREAYRQVAASAGKKSFRATTPENYSHLGSIGNTGTEIIEERAGEVASSVRGVGATEIAASVASALTRR